MPVFHSVFHGYGTWHPDHARGWHQHDFARPLATHVGLGRYRRSVQQQLTTTFCAGAQWALVDMAVDACKRRSIRCHAVAAGETHVHVVMSWVKGHDAMSMHHTLKRLMGLRMGAFYGVRGRRWFSHGGRPKGVANLEHFEILVKDYLPKQGGVFWREGEDLPTWRRLVGN